MWSFKLNQIINYKNNNTKLIILLIKIIFLDLFLTMNKFKLVNNTFLLLGRGFIGKNPSALMGYTVNITGVHMR